MERPQSTNRPTWRDPSRRFCYLLSLMPIGFGVVAWLGFAHSLQGALMAVVVFFLTAIVVAVPWLLYRLLTGDQERQDEGGLRDWLQGYFDIATGRVEAKEFAIQVLIAPMAAVIGLAAIAVVLALATS
jgi:hypothetical protein